MSADELNTIAAVLRGCASPCNLLVFGLSHETLLWNSLNHNGRTVFVSDSAYLVSKLEEKHLSIEAYHVQLTTKGKRIYDLIEYSKGELRGEYRPVQNLLFSDCKLVVNNLPNHLYDVAWDVILVDGPRAYFGEAPGWMSAILTAGVMARRKRAGADSIGRWRGFAARSSCVENLVETKDLLGYFVIGKFEDNRNRVGFCSVSPN